MIDLSSHILGETKQLIEVDTRDDLRQLILSMSEQAKHRILIFSQDLDHSLFDGNELYEAVKTLAIASHRTHVHILVQNAKPMTQKGHRLLNLARRISSHIKIKVTAREHHNIIENFIIFDEKAYIIQNNPERFDAHGNYYEPLKTRLLNDQFDEMWEHAFIDSTLRRLSL